MALARARLLRQEPCSRRFHSRSHSWSSDRNALWISTCAIYIRWKLLEKNHHQDELQPWLSWVLGESAVKRTLLFPWRPATDADSASLIDSRRTWCPIEANDLKHPCCESQEKYGTCCSEFWHWKTHTHSTCDDLVELHCGLVGILKL